MTNSIGLVAWTQLVCNSTLSISTEKTLARLVSPYHSTCTCSLDWGRAVSDTVTSEG